VQVQHGGVRLDRGGESVDVREGQGRQGALQHEMIGTVVEIKLLLPDHCFQIHFKSKHTVPVPHCRLPMIYVKNDKTMLILIFS
jgi:hypothetical protein